MIDSLGRKEINYFCKSCKNITTFVLINCKWECCCCNPLLIPDEKLIGFTIGEVIEMKREN